MPDFCPGYAGAFKALARDYPGRETYPSKDFRVEWGPIFHRGRLDGTARVLLIGQDPGQHENVVRRILVGEAGRRVQGFLTKLGITKRYVLVNALLYSVYGNSGGKYVARTALRAYRDQWFDALLAPRKLEAVVTFGGMAKTAWREYVNNAANAANVTNAATAGNLEVAHLFHPTFPEAAGGTPEAIAKNTKKMLKQWNAALPRLRAAITHKDQAVSASDLYGESFTDQDFSPIPPFDLPAGLPTWMYENNGWAARTGEDPGTRRRTLTLTVPPEVVL